MNSSLVVEGSAARLNGVADLSPSDAWAVGIGSGGTLLAHSNGSAWSPVTIPDPDFSAARTIHLG